VVIFEVSLNASKMAAQQTLVKMMFVMAYHSCDEASQYRPQLAASNALARARALFGDPLLVRAPPGGLRRTPRTDAMREPLRAALAELAVIVAAGPPDLADLRGAVRLVVSDVPAAALGAALTAALAKRAPGIDLIFHPWHAGDEVERLERGEVDLVVTVASTRRIAAD
jgi:DNA-binding transcriptional LysR family regulator